MQALKYISFSGVSETYMRPLAYGLSRSNISMQTDVLNEAAAQCLSAIGVDAQYATRDDEEYPWLWIEGVPFLLGRTPNSTAIYFATGSNNYVVSSTISASEVTVVACGNPNGVYCLFLYTGSTYRAVFYFGKIWNIFNTIEYGFAYADSKIRVYDMESWESLIFEDGSFNPKAYVRSTLKEFIGDSFPLAPVSITVASDDMSTRTVYFKGVYTYPMEMNLPSASSTPYQREILIGDRKFLVSGTFGLIALEDDDPLISEEEFLEGRT